MIGEQAALMEAALTNVLVLQMNQVKQQKERKKLLCPCLYVLWILATKDMNIYKLTY